MTVDEIYKLSKAYMFEKGSSTIYDQYLISNLNYILSELFNENNMERMFNGKAPLTERIVVTQRTDDVPYEDVYCREIIPLGLVARFEIDDDLSKYNLFNTDYLNARIKNQKLVSKEKIDALTSITTI